MPVKNNNRPDRGKNRKAGNAPELSAEDKRRQLAKELNLKPRTVAMIEMMENDKTLSQTEAYIRTHETNNRKNASIAAARLLAKPSVRIYSDSALRKAKRRIVSLVDSSNESIALKASTDIVDRREGKAVQVSENTTRTVKVSLDLSGLRLGSHYIKAEQLEPQT